jgi:hypothetical protein
MYNQSSSRPERPRGCLLPGLVSAGLLIVIMVVFMFYSRNRKIVVEMEVEKGKADSLVAVDNLSKKCASISYLTVRYRQNTSTYVVY